MSTYDYTSLDKVKRIIRSSGGDPSIQKKIHFSDSHSLPKKYSSNTGSCMLLDVDIGGDYVGIEHWIVAFTSTTDFILYRGEDELSSDGSGSINSEFLSSSGIITIKTTYWVGTPVSGDKFKFETLANVSNADAEQYISDAEDIVNAELEKFIGSSNVPFEGEIPSKVDTATAYISSFLLYSSIFSPNSDRELPTFAGRWYKIGTSLISSYLETISSKLVRHAKFIPRFIGREPLFDSVGITEAAGIGLAVGDDKGSINTQDVEFDKFFNTEEGGD